MKSFENFVKQGVVKRRSPNKNRAENLVLEANRKLEQIKRNIKQVGIDDENANNIIESCYDVLIGLTRSKMVVEGFSSSGHGAHEGEVAFFSELGFNNSEIIFMNNLRRFRNGILYYGEKFKEDYAKQTIEFMNNALEKLK